MNQHKPTASAGRKGDERAFAFLPLNERERKPRKHGVTEIRGPYYTPLGRRYLEDILETLGQYVDALKFAGGSFSLMPRKALKELLDLCHAHDVMVSTGGFKLRHRCRSWLGYSTRSGSPS